MILLTGPTTIDVWVVTKIGSCLGRHPALDMAVQGAIEHNILGGLLFGASLFGVWVASLKTADSSTQRRLFTIILGCAIAIAATFGLAAAVKWPPPSQQLGPLFPGYLPGNANPSSFPSQSTALYSTIAAGIFSLRRRLGVLLWISVLVIIALPRVYVGGHYPTDILVGLACGVMGFAVARRLENLFPHRLDTVLQRNSGFWAISAAVFIILLQVSTEFRDVGWIRQNFWLFSMRSADRLCIGGDTAFGQHFNGRIDEVRIYSRPLSAAEILRDMNSSVAGDKEARPTGLVAAYAFEEGAGKRAHDSSGNGHSGLVFGATWIPDGKYGSALSFDGSTSCVEVQDSPALHLTGRLTLEAWVYPVGNPRGWQDVIYKEVDAYYLQAASPQSTPAVGGSKCGFGDLYGPSRLTANTWTHLAATCDDQSVTLYINGVQVATRTNSRPY